MNTLLGLAIIAISAALLFYTLGVWSERFAGRLKPVHLILFWIGLIFDTTGTTLMSRIAGQMRPDLHGLTGLLAILLMLGHALWATKVLLARDEGSIRSFHKFSLFVWLVWLVPFASGLVGAMLG